MSNLSESKKLIAAIQAEKQRLAQNQFVPIDELRRLVFVSYACSMVSEGRGAELLCLDILSFRQQWQEWAALHPRMLEIFNSIPYDLDELVQDINNA